MRHISNTPHAVWVAQKQKCEIGSEQFSILLLLRSTYVETLFGMTYMYYAVLGTFVTLIVAIIVSYFTASEEDAFDENLLHPWVMKLRHWFNGTSPAARTEDIERNIESNVNNAYEITEECGQMGIDSIHSIVGDNSGPSINSNAINKSKTQVPIERFKKLSVS